MYAPNHVQSASVVCPNLWFCKIEYTYIQFTTFWAAENGCENANDHAMT